MTDDDSKDDKPLSECHPCEVYKAFDDFCKDLGRIPTDAEVKTTDGNVRLRAGQNACAVVSNFVEGDKVDAETYFNTLVRLYGADNVRDKALKHLAAPDALQKREVEGEKAPEGGTTPPTAKEDTEVKSGQGRANLPTDTNGVPPPVTPLSEGAEGAEKEVEDHE